MVDSEYITAVTAVLCIFVVYILMLHFLDKDTTPATDHKYIKIKNQIVSVPNHVLDAILAKYKTRLVNSSNSNIHFDQQKLDKVEKELARHIGLKYGIQFNLYPDQLEQYIMDKGIKQSNTYDDDLVGGLDLTDNAKSLGTIIWYLEQISKQNKNKAGDIEIPLSLHDIDGAMNIGLKFKEYKKLSLELPEGLAVELPETVENDYHVVDYFDGKEQWRRPITGAPMPTSHTDRLRNNLHNFISDSAARDVYDDYIGTGEADDLYSKSKNTREAVAGWQNTNSFRMADMSQTLKEDFGITNTRKLNPHIHSDVNDLALDIMRKEKYDATIPYLNQKQAISDKWDYIESKILNQ